MRNVFPILISMLFAIPCKAGDWPQWRYDAGRSGSTPDELPAKLRLQWVREFPKPSPAWPDSQKALQFDRSYEPVVMGKTIFVPSSVSDTLTAYETETGKEKWRFYAEGPVRFAPVAYSSPSAGSSSSTGSPSTGSSQARVYFTSDDGSLYCLNAATGSLIWKVRGGPRDQRVIGNNRMVSMWPARGGPVLYDGTIYFAAGIWPFMGIFVHAVDAETGEVRWTQSGSGSRFGTQPHGSTAFGGVAPQGYLAANRDTLLVHGGRTTPAAFDRKTGRFLYYNIDAWVRDDNRLNHAVAVTDRFFFYRGGMFEVKNGKNLGTVGRGVFAGDMIYGTEEEGLVIRKLLPPVDDQPGYGRVMQWGAEKQATLRNAPPRILLKAGNRLFGAYADGRIAAVDLGRLRAPAIGWESRVDGSVWSMAAADDRLFVVTEGGKLFCFGRAPCAAPQHKCRPVELPAGRNRRAIPIADVVKACPRSDGYCVVLGLEDDSRVEELLARGRWHVIVIDSDAAKVETLRRQMDEAGLYGARVNAFIGDPLTFPLPPYIADLIVAGQPFPSETLEKPESRRILNAIRPYGGMAWFSAGENKSALLQWVKTAEIKGIEAAESGDAIVVRRPGPLPGSAPWTHQYADAAKTVMSRDDLVKAPLGLLWFGGPPNDPILPRHGHGPAPQVCGGRLFIEGRDLLRAVDVYTGRLLWERAIHGLGEYYDTTMHQPGVDETGGNFAAAEDGVYVATPESCVRLNPETGETIPIPGGAPDGGFKIPRQKDEGTLNWGFVAVSTDLLVTAAAPMGLSRTYGFDSPEARPVANPAEGLHGLPEVTVNARHAASSGMLAVFDRHDGRLLWSRKAATAFRHNAIAVGGGKVFCIDGLNWQAREFLWRRGLNGEVNSVLYALDARTGKVEWQTAEDVFGTWLGYSEQRDLLLQAGNRGRDRPWDEIGQGMVARRGKDGKVVWQNLSIEYRGPCMLGQKAIITQSSAVDWQTGEPVMSAHPLTGQMLPWAMTRSYGCGSLVGSEHLLLFRSGAAGYYDLDRRGGTGNIAGFRSGCTSNLIPADGVLNAPDYTRTCTCLFQIQSSLAMIHMPSAEMWTYLEIPWDGQRVRQVGVNIGAPGDRMADNGTLWLDYPSVGGPSPDIPIRFVGGKQELFRHHSSLFQGDLAWVGSSGVMDVEAIGMMLSRERDAQTYTLRLVFAEPDLKARDGSRVFDVNVQRRRVLTDFDICREAGGPRRVLIKEIPDVRVSNVLMIDFKAKTGKPVICGVEAVMQQ